MKRDGFPSPVSEVLGRIFSRRGIDKKMKEMSVLKLWKEVVGKKIDKHTYPFSVKKGKLFVQVDNSGWLVQLTYLKDEIMAELNKKEGGKLINDIYFRLGEIKKGREGKAKKPLPTKRVKLERAELDEIERSLKGVKDKALHQILGRVLIKDKKLKKTLN
jgi:hypothetical protein